MTLFRPGTAAVAPRCLFAPILACACLAIGTPLAGGAQPVDPQVQTVFFHPFQAIWSPESHVFQAFGNSGDSTQLISMKMPVDGSAPSELVRPIPGDFVGLGGMRGLVFGYRNDPDSSALQAFQIIDGETAEVVASLPSQGWYLAADRVQVGDEYLGVVRGGVPQPLLVRFSAATRSITTLPLPGLPQGMGSNTLVGAGEGWLAFYRSWLNEEEKLLLLSPETGELMSVVRMGRETFSTVDNPFAAGADHQFLQTGSGVRAFNIRDGSSKIVGAGGAEVIKHPIALAASGQDLWIYGNSTSEAFSSMELQQWRIDAAGEWHLSFRGVPSRPGGFNSSRYVRLVSSGDGVLVQHDGKVDYFVPRLARPILRPPAGVVLKDSVAGQKITLELDRAPEHPVSVRIRNAGGTATAGTDYVPIDKQVIFPAGATRVSLDFDVLPDLLPESNETVLLEFSQPLGLSLPEVRTGSLIIEASGPQLGELQLSSGGGPNVIPYAMISRGKDVTVGIASIPASSVPALCLWDSRTGALRGKVNVPVPDPNFPTHRVMETAAGLDVCYLESGKLAIYRIDPSNGSTLASSSFTIPYGYHSTAMLGAGRVFFASAGQGGTGNKYSARIYEIGGLPEGQPFAIPEVPEGRGLPMVCDGKHLAIAWQKESLSGEASQTFLKVYSVADLATSWVLDTSPYSLLELRAIRGDMLLARGKVGAMGIDLSRREVVWTSSALSIGPVGEEIWYDADSYDPSAYDIFTGVKIEGGIRVADSFRSEAQTAVDGPGGILFRDYDTYPVAGEVNPALRFRFLEPKNQRTRPGIQMLNLAMEESHDGAYLTLKALESTNVPVQVSARHVDSESGRFPKLTFAATPVTVPADGKPVGLYYHLQPSISVDPYLSDYRLNLTVTSPSSAPASGVHRLPLTSGIPRASAHLGTVIPGPAVPGEQPYVSLRACDGKLVAWTGFANGFYPSNPPNHRVDVIDPATGSLVRRIVDPSPNIYKRFGINATLQGNKLLVISREVGGEEGLAEVFDVSTGSRLAAITYTGNLPGFGDVIASNETYFAIAIPGMGIGKPAGSEVSVYRWSDFSRVTRKAAGNNLRFGSGIALRGNVLYVSSLGPGADPSKGRIQSFALPGGTVGAVPAGVSGVLGSTSGHLFVANETLRLYRWSGMQPAWSAPLKNYFSYPGLVTTGGGYVVVRDDRDVSLLSETTGAPVATTRFSDANTGLYGTLTAAEVMSGSVFTVNDGVLMKTPLKGLGDFAAWRRFEGLTLEQAPPSEDRDGNGVADFDDYVASRLNPDTPFAVAAHVGGKVRLSSSVMPPPDVLVLAEIEASSGVWTVLGWRDGRNPWQPGTPSTVDGSLLVDLPAGTSAASALRLRYLPHAGLGAGTGVAEWPPSTEVPQSGGVNPISPSGDQDGDGFPNWLELQARMGTGSPLALSSGDGRAGVSLLRPKGQASAALVETSADLGFWRPATEDPGVEVRIVPEDDQFERVTVRGKAGVSQRYFRLKY